MSEKALLIDVDIKATEALKELAELKLRADELKAAQKELDRSTVDGRVEYERYGQQIKALNSEARVYQKEIQSNIKHQNEQEGSLQKLKAELSLNTAAYNKLGEAERKSSKGNELNKKIVETTNKLKEEEEAIGNSRRSVGDYEKATRDLGGELGVMVKRLQDMRLEGAANSKEYQTLKTKAQELRGAMASVSSEVGGLGGSGGNMTLLMQSTQGVVGAFGAFQSIAGLSAEENEELVRSLRNMQIVMTALASITAITATMRRGGIPYIKAEQLLSKIGLSTTLARTKAEAAKNIVMGKGNILTKAAAAATWLWNAALAMNPVFLLAIAVTGLVVGLKVLVSLFSSSAKASRASAKAMKEYEAQVKSTDAQLDKIETKRTIVRNNAEKQGLKEMERLRKQGATKQELANAEGELSRKLRNIEAEAIRGRIKSNIELLKSQNKALQAKQAELSLHREGSKQYRKISEALAELNSEYRETQRVLSDDYLTAEKNRQDQLNADIEAKNQKIENTLNAYIKQSNARQKFNEQQLKAESDFQSDDFALRQKYERRLFDLQESGEIDRLNAQRRAGKITASEFSLEMETMAEARREFNNKERASANSHFEALKKDVISYASKTEQELIDDAVKSYTEAMKKLGEIDPPVRLEGMSDSDYTKLLEEHEEFLFKRAELTFRLEGKRDEEIENIRDQNLIKRATKIEEAIAKEYKGDLALFANNEREKLAIQRQIIQEQIEAKRKVGLAIFKEEGELQQNLLIQNQLDLNLNLHQVGANLDAEYALRKQALLKERELYRGNADELARIDEALMLLNSEHSQRRIENIENWVGASMALVGELNGLMNAISEGEMEKVREERETKQAELEDELNNGVITKEEFDNKKAELDAKMDKKQAEIERKKAVRDKAMRSFSVIADTAMGVARAVAESPLTFGMPWAAFVAAMGAVQLATIASAPLPKASRGRLIKGLSHRQGGEVIEAEGGEMIINKRSASMFAPLLSAINQAGGGIPFTTPMSDGGYTSRGASPTSAGIDFSQLVDAIENLEVITTIEDVRKGDIRYSRVADRYVY